MKFFQLIQVTSVPGGSFDKTLKSFSTKEKGNEWLKANNYNYNSSVKVWEREEDQDDLAWIYVKFKTVFVD